MATLSDFCFLTSDLWLLNPVIPRIRFSQGGKGKYFLFDHQGFREPLHEDF